MKIIYHAPESPKLWVGKLRHVSPSVRYFGIAIKIRQRHEAYTRSAWGNGFVGFTSTRTRVGISRKKENIDKQIKNY